MYITESAWVKKNKKKLKKKDRQTDEDFRCWKVDYLRYI